MLFKSAAALLCLGGVLAQRPFFITLKSGKKVKIGLKTLIHSDNSGVNVPGNYVAVTPEMLAGGYWDMLLKPSYERWGGIQMVKSYTSNHICLDNHWLIHNFMEGVTSTKDSEVAKSQTNGPKTNYCIGGSCQTRSHKFRSAPQFSYSEIKCWESGMFIKTSIHNQLKVDLSSNNQQNNWLIWEERPDEVIDQITTTPEPETIPVNNSVDLEILRLLQECEDSLKTLTDDNNLLELKIKKQKQQAEIDEETIRKNDIIIAENEATILENDGVLDKQEKRILELQAELAGLQTTQLSLLTEYGDLALELAGSSGSSSTTVKELEDEIARTRELIDKWTTDIEKCKTKEAALEEQCNAIDNELEEATKEFDQKLKDGNEGEEESWSINKDGPLLRCKNKPTCVAYKYFRTSAWVSRMEAAGICEDYGMNLVEMRDLYERECLENDIWRVHKYNSDGFWLGSSLRLGANKIPTRDMFKWSNGQPVDKYLSEPLINNMYIRDKNYELNFDEHFGYHSIWDKRYPYSYIYNDWTEAKEIAEIAKSRKSYYLNFTPAQGFRSVLNAVNPKDIKNHSYDKLNVICEIRNEQACDKVHTYRDRPIYVKRPDTTKSQPNSHTHNRDYANCGYKDIYGFPGENMDVYKTEGESSWKEEWLKLIKENKERQADYQASIADLTFPEGEEADFNAKISEMDYGDGKESSPIQTCNHKPSCVAYKPFNIGKQVSFEEAKAYCSEAGMELAEIRDIHEKDCVDNTEWEKWGHGPRGAKGIWLQKLSWRSKSTIPERSDFKWRNGFEVDQYLRSHTEAGGQRLLTNLWTEYGGNNWLQKAHDIPEFSTYGSIWGTNNPYDRIQRNDKKTLASQIDAVYLYYDWKEFKHYFRYTAGNTGSQKYPPHWTDNRGIMCEVRNEGECARLGYRDRDMFYSGEYPSTKSHQVSGTSAKEWGYNLANCGFEDRWQWPAKPFQHPKVLDDKRNDCDYRDKLYSTRPEGQSYYTLNFGKPFTVWEH